MRLGVRKREGFTKQCENRVRCGLGGKGGVKKNRRGKEHLSCFAMFFPVFSHDILLSRNYLHRFMGEETGLNTDVSEIVISFLSYNGKNASWHLG